MSISHIKILGVVFITSIVIAFPAFAAQLADGTPPPNGGYVAGDTILDPGCAPGDVDCYTNIGGGGSGWSLTGDAGTTVGTNFIGTTDAEDFMVKVNGVKAGLFGQNDAISFGSSANASGNNSMAWGANTIASGNTSTAFGGYNDGNLVGVDTNGNNGPTASGDGAVVWGGSIGGLNFPWASGSFSTSWGSGSIASSDYDTAWGSSSTASGGRATAWGNITTASGNMSTAWGYGSTASIDRATAWGNITTASGETSTAWGDSTIASGDLATTWGANVVASGTSSTAWGNTSNASGNRATAWGSSSTASGETSTAWGINTFASGQLSTAWGLGSNASGTRSTAWGSNAIAQGLISTAWGNSSTASGEKSTAWGNGAGADGDVSTAWGDSVAALSYLETVLGSYNTSYIANDATTFDTSDRLFNIGNGTAVGLESDAFTILKSGETGIGIDNFEANTNGNIFQVGDGTTNIIGYVDDVTGNWVAVSDERQKDNIKNITYGLDEINQLRPVSFDYKRNGEHTIGFIAQETMDIIPEAVFGSEDKGYGMSYQTLTPVLVQAVQELDVKVSLLEHAAGFETDNLVSHIEKIVDRYIASLESIFVKLVRSDRVETKELCVEDVCFSGDEITRLKELVSKETSDVHEESTLSLDDEQKEDSSDEVMSLEPESQEDVVVDEGNHQEELIPSIETIHDIDTETQQETILEGNNVL